MIDIDYFKLINDNYGHHAGDVTLEEIANIISLAVRESDIACRWGGEEFLILVANTKITELVQLAQRIRLLIEEHTVVIEAKIIEFKITVSIGVAISNVSNITNAENIIKEADERLYKAKESGRNCVIYE